MNLGETNTDNGFNAYSTSIYVQRLQTIYGCDSIITLNLEVLGLDDLKKKEKETSISIYPNPTKNIVNIDTKGEIINSYTLYNMGGQIIMKSEKLRVKR